MTTVALFVGGLLLIVVAAELFTNAVEWAGFRLGLAAGATGSLLAALGTALPETTVPLVAIIRGGADADAVAVGAIVGAPFLLLTLGVAITGAAVAARRRDPHLHPDMGQLRRDLGTFLAGFGVLLIAIALPHGVRIALAVGLVLLYARHVRATLSGSDPATEQPEALHIRRRSECPSGPAIAVQLGIAVAMLIAGAELFVRAVEQTGHAFHISPLLLAVVVVPVATELPEMFNSVLWVRSGDDGLAAGNVLGATAFQACLPGALGLAFTDWTPGPLGLVNGILTLLAGLYTLGLLHDGRTRGSLLMLSALPWAGYLVLVLAVGSRFQAA
ncbi:MAG TPA: sodium:calcium antiporter [Candidatus Dormibacteraeota bacterium]